MQALTIRPVPGCPAVGSFPLADPVYPFRPTVWQVGSIVLGAFAPARKPPHHRGSTAVASISSFAAGSTNRTTCTAAIAGKFRPKTAR